MRHFGKIDILPEASSAALRGGRVRRRSQERLGRAEAKRVTPSCSTEIRGSRHDTDDQI